MSGLLSFVYISGAWVSAAKASIPVLDRGFLFGDGVYEVIPVYNGQAFRLSEHLQRLQASLDAIKIDNPHSDEQWSQLIAELIEKNGYGDQKLYLQVTRGVMSFRDHVYDESLAPTVVMFSQAATYTPAKDQPGIKAITLDDIRWQFCNIKATTLLPNVMLKQQASQVAAEEAILIRDGKALEGSASNLFIVRDEIIMTPPKSNLLLAGITRDLVIELAREHKLPYRECDIPEDDLHDADEIWVTSSSREIAAVTTLNQHLVGKGKPGPIWQQMSQLFQQSKQALLESTP